MRFELDVGGRAEYDDESGDGREEGGGDGASFDASAGDAPSRVTDASAGEFSGPEGFPRRPDGELVKSLSNGSHVLKSSGLAPRPDRRFVRAHLGFDGSRGFGLVQAPKPQRQAPAFAAGSPDWSWCGICSQSQQSRLSSAVATEPRKGREPMLHAARTSLLVSLLVFGLGVAACGSSSSSSSSSSSAAAGSSASSSTTPNVGRVPTVKFVLHAGLAFGAFHRWIYKPLKHGTFSGGVLKHKLALVKAGLAGLFAYHELKLAIQDARASAKLQKLVAPITALGDKLKSIGDSAKSGNFDTSTITSANNDVTSLSGLAKQAGVSISPQEPSASALAAGG
jgi:hypothetical protein